MAGAAAFRATFFRKGWRLETSSLPIRHSVSVAFRIIELGNFALRDRAPRN